MPHSLFLGSALATQDRISSEPPKTLLHSPTGSQESFPQSNGKTISYPRRLFKIAIRYIASVFRINGEIEDTVKPKRHADRENNSLAFVQAHLYHGIFDMAISLLGFAVIINSLCVLICALVGRTDCLYAFRILILASAVFYFGSDKTSSPASLFDAHDLIRDNVGKGMHPLLLL